MTVGLELQRLTGKLAGDADQSLADGRIELGRLGEAVRCFGHDLVEERGGEVAGCSLVCCGGLGVCLSAMLLAVLAGCHGEGLLMV